MHLLNVCWVMCAASANSIRLTLWADIAPHGTHHIGKAQLKAQYNVIPDGHHVQMPRLADMQLALMLRTCHTQTD